MTQGKEAATQNKICSIFGPGYWDNLLEYKIDLARLKYMRCSNVVLFSGFLRGKRTKCDNDGTEFHSNEVCSGKASRDMG
jgi:hypothetical protein